jgi:hypothetical protein
MDSESSDMDSDVYNELVEAEAMYNAETARLKAVAEAAAQDGAGTSSNRKRARDCGNNQQVYFSQFADQLQIYICRAINFSLNLM